MLCPGKFIYVGCLLKWRQKLLSLNTTGIFLEPGGTTVLERALHGPAYSENGASRQTREASLARNLRDDQEARPTRRKRASPGGGEADSGRGEVGEPSSLAGRLLREDRGVGPGERAASTRDGGEWETRPGCWRAGAPAQPGAWPPGARAACRPGGGGKGGGTGGVLSGERGPREQGFGRG